VLSKRQWCSTLAALVFAVSVPAGAQGPVASVCSELRNDIDYYYGLWSEGGTPKQMKVWKRTYLRNIWQYGNAQCPKYDPKRGRGKARTAPVEDLNPIRGGKRALPPVEEPQQAAL